MEAFVEYDEASSAWLLETDNAELADRIHFDEGWGRTTRGDTLAPGVSCVYTREPHAAVHWIKACPEGSPARNLLLPVLADYQKSLALEHSFKLDVPDTLPDWLEPMKFQHAGVARGVELPHMILGDDMGVGKTAQAIMIGNSIQARKVLVSSPANARSQWVESIKVWSTVPNIYRKVHVIERTVDGIDPTAAYTVVSHDLLRSPEIYEALVEQDYDLFIGDEAHMFKTTDSGRSQHALGSLDGKIKGVASKAEKVLLLTGTPLPNRPRECYNLVRHTCWDAIDWLSEDAFMERYNPSFSARTGHTWEEHYRAPELRARLRCNVMVRRKLRAVLPQLPPERHEIMKLDLDSGIVDALKAESLLNIDVNNLDLRGNGFEDQQHVATARRMMGLALVPQVCRHAVQILDGGVPKLFIACFHREVMDILAEKLSSWGVCMIRGGQTPRQRDVQKKTFITDPKFKVMLGQFEASGQALDGLQTVCSRGLFAEPSWVHKDNVQIVGRLIRNGQRNGILWQYAVAPGSLSEQILGKSIVKGQIVDQFLDA